MPKFNLDEFSEKMFEPIRVTIGGIEYAVQKNGLRNYWIK